MDYKLLLIALYLAYAESGTTCPSGWVADIGSCYLFGTHGLRFTEAENYCRQNGGHLVEVNDAHENNFLKTFMKRFNVKYWWIGMTDEEVEDQWRLYTTGTLATFTDWFPGEDNTIGNKDTEDCALFAQVESFAWADGGCASSTVYPLCEISGQSCEESIVG